MNEENCQNGSHVYQENSQSNLANLIACKLCNASSTFPQEACIHRSLVSMEASIKREQRLMKNREAARMYRLKKKEYIKTLEDRVHLFKLLNESLTEELKALKEMSGFAFTDTHAQNML